MALLVKEILASNKPLVFSGVQRVGDPTRWVADRTKLYNLQTEIRVPELSVSIEKVIRSWQRVNTAPGKQNLSLPMHFRIVKQA